MGAPVINAINTLRQGTAAQAYLPKQSVVEIEVNFSTTGGENVNFTVQLSIDNGVTYHTATLNWAGNGQNVAPPGGGNAMVLVDVAATFTAQSLTLGVYTQCKVKLTATGVTSGLASSPFTSGAFSIKSTNPFIVGATMAQWIGQAQSTAAPYTLFADDTEGSGQVGLPETPTDLHTLRAALNPQTLVYSNPLAYSTFSANPTFNFTGAAEGPQTIYVQIYDQYFNASNIFSISTNLQLNAPSNCLVKLIGQQGNSDYTGITINPDGSFTPNRMVLAQMSAQSTTNIPLSFQVLTSSNVELRNNVGQNFLLGNSTSQQYLWLTTTQANPTVDNFNADATVTVSVKFFDAAGNFTVVNQTIRLNTRIYLTANKPLRHKTGAYQPQLHYISSGGADVFVPQSLILSSNPIRNWNEVFYPTTHGYPTNPDGTPNLTAVQADANLVQMLPNTLYDPLLISTTVANNVTTISLVVDSDNRPLTARWTEDGTKNYLNLESNNQSSLRSWVLNNTGYGPFSIEFEYFDLDMTITGPPFNTQSPYKGDVLVVYDASAPGALTQSLDAFGNVSYTINNSTLLKEIFTFAGTGANIVNLTTGTPVGSTAAGQFISPPITTTSIVAIVLYTDPANTASGFKVKAGLRHDRQFFNYDVDETNGQAWIHIHESLADSKVRGAADTTTKRLYYDYIPNPLTIDVNAGTITFIGNPSGTVSADYSFYIADTSPVNTFIASKSDFVDYNDAQVFVVPSGMVVTPSGTKATATFENQGFGRMMQYYSWDKDRGVLTISPTGYYIAAQSGQLQPNGYVPIDQRITADYYYHTYKRLSSDGFGDLNFRDPILVADVTPNFPDYTWTDVKIINEGNTDLSNTSIKFVPRGYDTDGDGNITLTGNNIVDQVLDINRPWDIQMGTKDETYTKMAMALNASYIWQQLCPRLGGDGIQGNSGAGAIFSTWQNKVYGTIPMRTTIYGRVVWILGGAAGSAYPTAITAGPKRTSFELMGNYYASLVI